jgi:molybdopterin synthase sulfur carrier subunit
MKGSIMAIKVQIPAPLRQHTNGLAVVEVAGASVQQALDALVGQYPALAERIMQNGKLRPFVNLFVNDEDIRYLDGVETALDGASVISIIPAVAGG